MQSVESPMIKKLNWQKKLWSIGKDSEKIPTFNRIEICSNNQEMIIFMQSEKQKINYERSS